MMLARTIAGKRGSARDTTGKSVIIRWSMADRPDRTQPRPPGRNRRAQARQIGALVLGALGAAFALLNLDKVEVNWIIGTFSTPLIVVIAASILVGAALGLLVGRRRARS
jgi:uncharacterized integral membrane protein